MTIAVGDRVRIREGVDMRDFKAGQVGVVHHLGVKYEGDVRVKFPHDPDLLWVYPEFYEKEQVD